MNTVEKKPRTKHEPLVYITKRSDLSPKKALLVRAAVIFGGILCCAIVILLLTGANPFNVFGAIVYGSFGSPGKIWNLLQDTAILLGISVAVTPAFKMRFWNTGAEGQVLVGMLASVACMFYLKDSLPSFLTIIIMLISSTLAGMIWAGIPGFFKAIWNTNETLFTLMMNYVAAQMVSFFCRKWTPYSDGLGIINADSKNGWLPTIFGKKQLLIILIVAVITALVYIYLKRSKQGYEISVVGESENTARYIGINVKKTIIRTVLISGALCGIMGWLIASGNSHTILKDSVGGNGFTAIMVSWMSKFNPIIMVFSSLLVCFLQKGTGQIVSVLGPGASNVGSILTGIMILSVVASEFFVNYNVHFRHKAEKNDKEVAKNVND